MPWLVCILVLFTPAVHAQAVSGGAGTGTITGTIRDEGGRPLAGARVELEGDHPDKALQTAFTGVDGQYSFPNIRFGAYILVAHLNGYATRQSDEVELASRALVLNIELRHSEGFMMSSPESAGSDRAPGSSTPAFASAGVRGSTTAGGYSAAGEEEDNAEVLHGVAGLSWEDLASVAQSGENVDCGAETSLLRLARTEPTGFDANHKLGMFYLEHGDAVQGIRYLQIASQADPTNTGNARDLAFAYIETKDYGDAIALLQKNIPKGSEDPVSDRLLAEAYLAIGDPLKSISLLRSAAKLDESESNIYRCGIGLIIAGSPQAAYSILSSALDKHPKSARLWLGSGLAQSLQGDKLRAIQALLRAVDLDPEYSPAYFFLANLAGVSEATDLQIARRLRGYVASHPGVPTAHFDDALALWNSTRHNPATASWSEIETQLSLALAQQPRFAEAHYELGVVYAESGKYSLAIRELQAAIRLDPQHVEAHYRLSQAYRREHQNSAADRELQEFQRLQAEHVQDQSAGTLVAEELNRQRAYVSPCGPPSDITEKPGAPSAALGPHK